MPERYRDKQTSAALDSHFHSANLLSSVTTPSTSTPKEWKSIVSRKGRVDRAQHLHRRESLHQWMMPTHSISTATSRTTQVRHFSGILALSTKNMDRTHRYRQTSAHCHHMPLDSARGVPIMRATHSPVAGPIYVSESFASV